MSRNLPTEAEVSEAPLPEMYERARGALAEAQRVDECKDWADKAAALASYARQADDDELYKMARRIQGRAVRRCGELLKEFQADREKNLLQNRSKGTLTSGEPPPESEPTTQREAAERAGMSLHQERTARRVSEVPENEFEAAVESDEPPSVTALAERGRTALTEEKPEGFKAATAALGGFRQLAEFCTDNAPALVASGLRDREVEDFARNLTAVQEWIDGFHETRRTEDVRDTA